MKKIYYKIFILFLLKLILILYITGCSPSRPAADRILKNGTFFTADEKNPLAQAVVIKNQHILYVGNNKEALKYAHNHTDIIDLQGKFGCPGFNDANVNLLNDAKLKNALDFSGVTSILEIQRKVLKKIRENQNYDEWVIAKNWDPTKLELDDWPDRKILDRIAPYVPIILFTDDGHAALANAQTLRIARIWDNPAEIQGGEILRNPKTGNVTGILKEKAMDLVSQFLPKSPDQQVIQILHEQIQEAAKLGITTLQDKSSLEILPFIEKLEKQKKLPCNLCLAYPLNQNLNDYIELKRRFTKTQVTITPLKTDIDGCTKSRTALLSAPYADKTSTKGLSHISFDKLSELIILADQNNLLVQIHASGDAAVKKAVEVFEFTQTVNQIKNRRFLLEGVEIIHPDIIDSLRDLNMVIIMNPNLCMDAVRWMDKKIGVNRSRFAYPFSTIYSSGAALAFGSGYPYGELNPLYGIYAAVTKKDSTGQPPHGWHPQEGLTIQQAITAYTLGSAKAEHKENEKGSLERGKLADIVILDKNILQIPYQDILDTKVVCTIAGGKIVYGKKQKE